MHLEEFAEGKSFFHKLDPRVKFLTFIPYIMVIAIANGLRIPVMALILSFIMAVIAELNKKKLLNRLIVVNIFVFILWLFIPFSYPGEEFFRIGPLIASKEGFLYVLSITMKTNAIVLATIAILGTSEIFSLAHAFVHLKVPSKLVHLFFFFYRYISVLHEEYTRLKRAMIIRSFKPGTNIHTYKSYAYLVGMLIVSSYERSQRIYSAMLCRGFTGKFPVIDHFSLRKSDIMFGLLMSVVTLIMIYIM
jgi:cobalt/nickel transport system permease protein